MRGRTLILVALFAAVSFAGCTTPANDNDMEETDAPSVANEPCFPGRGFPEQAGDPTVEFDTAFGTIVLRIYQNAVPVTADNFLAIVRNGTYDGTTFHRIITDFMMQGGDPNSKDDDPSNDGFGGTPKKVRDEFHHLLRHDRAGLLSMANSGPNTGTSQFFITFGPTPHLDDRHTVFGEVVEGMDVVERVNEEAATADGKPSVRVTLDKATVRSEGTEVVGTNEACIWAPDPLHQVPAAGGETEYLVVVENGGSHRTEATLTIEAPSGVTAAVEEGFQTFPLPGRQRVTVVVTATAAEEADEHSILLVQVQTADGATAEQPLVVSRSPKVGPATVQMGDELEAHYIGMTVDGRIFDTSVESLASDEDVPKYATFRFRGEGKYAPFEFAAGGQVIQGFTDLALGTPEGGESAGRIPPAQAYGERGQSPLAGRTLLFQLEVLDIK